MHTGATGANSTPPGSNVRPPWYTNNMITTKGNEMTNHAVVQTNVKCDHILCIGRNSQASVAVEYAYTNGNMSYTNACFPCFNEMLNMLSMYSIDHTIRYL